MMDTTTNLALMLAASVNAAVINKIKHYNQAGDLLPTGGAIIEELTNNKPVTFDVSEQEEITTPELEYRKLVNALDF